MIFTIHRYIFREAFRVFLLATIALTVMLSIGSILRPVQEFGVGPRQVVHLMSYFLPITLTFVLPMAALFSATLVYGRFASDNELNACRAGGISMLTLVYPGLALAIMVAIANLLLSFHVMPAFVKRAEKSLKADAQQIVFRNIERRGYYKPSDGKYLIYADKADSENERLSGVIITEVKDASIGRIVTAENARVHFVSHGDKYNEVRITAYKTYQIGIEDDEGGFYAESLSLTKELPSLMADDIKFKKIDEMKEIAGNPMEFYPIEKEAGMVYAQFAVELLARDIAGRIDNNPNRFYRLACGENFVEFSAKECNALDEERIELLGEVVVRDGTKRPLRTLRCSKALLYIVGDKLAPTLTMEMYNAKWKDSNGLEILARRPIIYGLLLPESVMPEVVAESGAAGVFSSAAILESVDPDTIASVLREDVSSVLTGLSEGLQRRIQRTIVKIDAEIHSRLVFGIGCTPLIMIGIGLGIIKRGGHLLTAFGISAVPAGLLIVCIMMGKNIAKNPGSQAGLGIALIWAGLGLLCFLAVLVYRKLLEN
jgi:lipopolysaccharide export LptBFGC system permease protein LptF